MNKKDKKKYEYQWRNAVNREEKIVILADLMWELRKENPQKYLAILTTCCRLKHELN